MAKKGKKEKKKKKKKKRREKLKGHPLTRSINEIQESNTITAQNHLEAVVLNHPTKHLSNNYRWLLRIYNISHQPLPPIWHAQQFYK